VLLYFTLYDINPGTLREVKTMQEENMKTRIMAKKCLIVVYSYHHNNTARIAKVLSEVLNATVKTPEQVVLEELHEYDLIGFGAGIDSGRHYKPLLDFVDTLPAVNKKAGFIFSTSAIQGENKVKKDHSLLRQKLESKGYTVIGDFSCLGFNTNSFLKYFGGINKGRPNGEDIKNAEKFALSLKLNERTNL
jgi:flavodoxin